MSVSVERSRSVRSATTLSFWRFSIASFPPEMTSPLEAGQRSAWNPSIATSAGLLPFGCQLSSAVPVLDLGGHCSGFRFDGIRGFVLDDATGAGVDLDPRAHRRGERDLPDVAALRGRGLRSNDLVDERSVILQQRALLEALLAECHVYV